MPTSGTPQIWVPADGPIPSNLLLVGEAPGEQEVRMKRGFCGKSGDELFDLLYSLAYISRSDCRVTNLFHWPISVAESQIPAIDWQVASTGLFKEIDLVKRPGSKLFILALGAMATHALLPQTKLRDMETVNALPHYLTHNNKDIIVIPSFHPAASFRDSSKLQYTVDAIKSLKLVMQGKRQAHSVSIVHTEVTDLSRQLESTGPLGMDTETYRDGCCYIIGVSGHEGEAALIDLSTGRGIKDMLALRSVVKDRTVLLHNAMFDIPVLGKAGVDVVKWYDTMTIAFLLQYLPLSLKELGYRLCHALMREYSDVVGDYEDLSKVPDRYSVEQYAAGDPNITLQVYNRLRPLWYPRMDETLQLDMDLQPMVIAMMQRGIIFDGSILAELDRELDIENFRRLLQIQRMAKQYGFTEAVKSGKNKGMTFNPRSSLQLGELLYNRLSLDKGKKIKKTASNRLSTSKKMTALMRGEHPIIELIEKYKETATLRSSFLQKLQTHIEADGRIHADFSMVRIPHSGRFAVSKPNLLAIPVRSENGNKIRGAVKAAEGFTLVSGDLSQIELRCLAHNTQDPVMLDIYRTDKDIHSTTAINIFGINDPRLRDPKNLDDYKHRLPAKCYHPDTEVLTRDGWKRIVDVNSGEEVLQAIPRDDGMVDLEWVVPTEVFTQYHSSKKLTHMHNAGIDIRVTPDHRMLGWRSVSGRPFVEYPESWVKRSMYWANAGVLNNRGMTASQDLIRLAVALQADGTITSDRQVKWGFVRERKIQRIQLLLNRAGIPFRVLAHRYSYDPTRKVTVISLRVKDSKALIDLLDKDKTYPWWWLNLSHDCRIAALEELECWDGRRISERRIEMFSYKKKNLDVMQAIAAISGKKSKQGINRMSIGDRCISLSGNIKTSTSEYADKVACLSVPSTFVLVRDKGIPVICGQTTNFLICNLGTASALSREILAAGGDKVWTVDKCQELIDSWFGVYPTVKKSLDATGRRAQSMGFITDMWGRRELLPQFYSGNERTREEGVRIACNQQIQCLPYNTRVLTSEGYVRIGDFIDGDVWTGERWAGAVKLNKGIGEIVHVEFYDGGILMCDTCHKILIVRGVWPIWVNVMDLQDNDMTPNSFADTDNDTGGLLLEDEEFWYWVGRYYGDGNLYHKPPPDRRYAVSWAFGGTKIEDAAKLITYLKARGHNPSSNTQYRHKMSNPVIKVTDRKMNRTMIEYGITPNQIASTKRIADVVFRLNLSRRRAVVQGYYDADGTTRKKYTHQMAPEQITSVNIDLLRDTQLLLRSVGRYSYIKGPYKHLPNKISGKIHSPFYRLIITDRPQYRRVKQVIKTNKVEKVYTLFVNDEKHAFDSEGVISKNSGAQGIMKRIMRNIWVNWLRDAVERGIAYPLMQVHDDLILEVREEYAVEAVKVMKYWMENSCPELSVPVKVGLKTGKVWRTMEKYKGEGND